MKTFVIDHTNLRQALESKSLQPAQPAPEPEPAEVELIASGYEWTCPKEGYEYIENKEIEITETVTCKKCGTTYKVNDYHHAHG